MYSFSDSSNLAPTSGAYGNFGLNTGVFLTKFEFNPNGGAGGSAKDTLDITFKVKDQEISTRIFPLERAESDTDEDFEKRVKAYTASLSDIVKSFVSVEELKLALANPVASFKEYVEILVKLVKKNPNFDKVPLDLFLEYSPSINKGADRTYLGIPRYRKVYQGLFVCPTKGEGFKEVRENEALAYVNDKGEKHPFERSAWYMKSNYANQQKLTNPQDSTTAEEDVFGASTQPTGNVGDLPF